MINTVFFGRIFHVRFAVGLIFLVRCAMWTNFLGDEFTYYREMDLTPFGLLFRSPRPGLSGHTYRILQRPSGLQRASWTEVKDTAWFYCFATLYICCKGKVGPSLEHQFFPEILISPSWLPSSGHLFLLSTFSLSWLQLTLIDSYEIIRLIVSVCYEQSKNKSLTQRRGNRYLNSLDNVHKGLTNLDRESTRSRILRNALSIISTMLKPSNTPKLPRYGGILATGWW